MSTEDKVFKEALHASDILLSDGNDIVFAVKQIKNQDIFLNNKLF